MSRLTEKEKLNSGDLYKMDKLTIEQIKQFPLTPYGRMIGKQLATQVMNELIAYKQIEKELGVDLVALFNGLKTKQSGLRYFNKFDAGINHMQQGWYVRMIMYGWIPLIDFVEAVTKEELEK